MASEKLVIELWEIVQKENNEKISYDVFENDLNDALNLPRDEVDRALALMLSQAEVNPNLIGEYKGGSFVISSSFTNIIVSTIKYENQFIPGKVEYDARVIGENINSDIAIGAIILTQSLLDKMIENYGELSNEEIGKLWDEYPDMDSNQKRALRKAREEKLESIAQDDQTPEEVKEMASDMKSHSEIRGNVSESMDDKSDTGFFIARETFKSLRESDPEKFAEKFPDLVNVDLDTVSDEKIKYEWGRYEQLSAEAEDKALDEKQKQIISAARETFKKLAIARPDLVKKYFPILNNQDLENISEDIILKALAILKELQNNRDKDTLGEIGGIDNDDSFGMEPIIEADKVFRSLYEIEDTGKVALNESYDKSTCSWFTDSLDKVLRKDVVKNKMMQELVENAGLYFGSTNRMQEVMRIISEHLPQCDVTIDLVASSRVVRKLITTIPEEYKVTVEELNAIFMGTHEKALLGMLRSDPKGMSHMFGEPQKFYDYVQADTEYPFHLNDKKRSTQRQSETITDKEFSPIVEEQSEELFVNMDDLMQGMGAFSSEVGQSETVAAFSLGYETVGDTPQENGMIQDSETTNIVGKKGSSTYIKSEKTEFYENTKENSINSDVNGLKSLKEAVKGVRMSKIKSEISDIFKIMEPVTQMIEDSALEEEKI